MEKVFKIIFRLDFPINYSIMNTPGTLLKMLQKKDDDQWNTQEIGHKAVPEFRVKKNEELDAFTLTVSARSIIGLWDTKTAIALQDVHESHVFRLLTKLTDEILEEFQIHELERCGLRSFFYIPCGNDHEAAFKVLAESFDTQVIGIAESTSGVIKDFGMTLEGEFSEHSGFRVMFGPLAPLQLNQFAELIQLTDEDHPAHGAVMADVDIFEKNFSLAYASFRRWCRERWKTFNEFSGALTGIVNHDTDGE